MTSFGRFGSRGLSMVALALLLVALAGCETNLQIREQGHTARRQGDLAAAEAQYARAAQRDPTDPLAHYYLGLVKLEQGQPLEAQLALEKALAIKSADPEWTPRILDKLAEAIYRQNRPANLHAFLARTVRTYGSSRDYLRQAEYLAKTGDLDQAQLAYRKAAYFAPEGDATPYLAIAEFYESLNDVPNAVAALRYAYYVAPENPKVASMFRRFGVVPGPTVGQEPPKPEMLR